MKATNMVKIADNTWQVGTCTLQKVRNWWYVRDRKGGLAGFTTRKAALLCCEHCNASAAED